MKKEFDIFKNISPSEKPGIPDGYLDQLENDMLSKIETPTVKEVSMFRKTSFWMGLATAASIGFIVILSTRNNNTTQVAENKSISIESISTQEVENYISESIVELDDEVLANMLVTEEKIDLNKNTELDHIDIETIESYLEDYFVEDENKDV